MPNKMKPPYEWLIMIYMASDDTYSDEAAKNFLNELNEIGKEFDKTGEQGKVKILLLSMGKWNKRGEKRAYYSRCYEIKEDFLNGDRITFDVLNANMGDPAILTDFMLRCKDRYHAEKHLLLLWGHGTGSSMYEFRQKESLGNIKYLKKWLTIVKTQDLPPIQDQFFNDKLIQRQSINGEKLKKTHLFYLNVSKHKELKKYLPGTARLDALSAGEIAKSLGRCFGKNSGKIDVVVILGCAMQMVEFGYEIRKYCKYYVASEELIFWEGYNYKKTFLDLARNPGKSARQLGINLVLDTVKKKSYTKSEKKEIAISCVDLQLSAQLAKDIDNISKELIKMLPPVIDLIAEARIQCYHFGEKNFDSYIDVVWYFKNLAWLVKKYGNNKSLLKKIENFIKLVGKKYIVAKYVGKGRSAGKIYKPAIGGHGVSIYYPASRMDNYNNQLRGVPFNRKSLFRVKFTNNSWTELVIKTINQLKGNPQIFDPRI